MRIKHFRTGKGADVFQIRLDAFPDLIGFAYLVLVNYGDETEREKRYRVLIDPGSGFGESTRQLEEGLDEISEAVNEKVELANLTHIFVTHAHIDHFGSLSYIRPKIKAQIGIHELDLRNLVNYEERILIVSQRLRTFFNEAGVPSDEIRELLNLYKSMKYLFQSIAVDFTFEKIGMKLGPFEFLHVPGHSAGHVVIRLHDVLFCGDHVLSQITPHQSPERLTLSTGLEHYLDSLNLLKKWAKDVTIVFPGHEDVITDMDKRITEIQAEHKKRIRFILDKLVVPKTIYELSMELFKEVKGYNVLLAIEETGAHVEYLYQRGYLKIANLQEEEKSQQMVPIEYQCVPCTGNLLSERS